MVYKIKRQIWTFTLISVLVSCLLVLSSCGVKKNEEEGRGSDTLSDVHGNESDEQKDESQNKADTLISPSYKDYGKKTVPFSETVYERPNVKSVENAASEITKDIAKEEIGVDTLLGKMENLYASLENLSTMKSYAALMLKKDSSLGFFSEEYTYLCDAELSLNTGIRKMMAAFGASSYESKIGDAPCVALLKKVYSESTDTALTALREEENGLLDEFRALSQSTVKVTFNQETDTCENLLKKYRDKYGEQSSAYASASTVILNAFTNEIAAAKFDLYLELLVTRRKIADTLGVESYADAAYADFGSESYHDYTQKQAKALLDEISEILLPVYDRLDTLIFSPYFATAVPSTGTFSSVELMNEIYRVTEEEDDDFFNVYCYLLQNELFDVNEKGNLRDSENETLYLSDYEAPYLFLTTDGSYSDFVHFAEQFGSFLDFYINGSSPLSSDFRIAEEASLGLFAMNKAEEIIPASAFTYLKYKTVQEALQSILENALFARFESEVYALPIDQITEGKVKNLFAECAAEFGFTSLGVDAFPYVIIGRLMETPFSSQSLAVGNLCALELMLAHTDSLEEGLNSYKALITRNGQTKTLFDAYKEENLPSLFDGNALRDLSDDLHFYVAGYRYYQTQKDSPNAS